MSNSMRSWIALCLSLGLVSLSGCALFVMAGKMFGNPEQDAPFKTITRIDLPKAKLKAAVLVSAPKSVLGDHNSIDLDLLRETSFSLKQAGIQMVDQNKIATYIDDRGGKIGNLEKFAKELEAEIVIQIQVDDFRVLEPNSANLLRGHCEGVIDVYRYRKQGEQWQMTKIYTTTFNSNYPKTAPKPLESTTEIAFQRKYIKRVALQIAQMFYDHEANQEF